MFKIIFTEEKKSLSHYPNDGTDAFQDFKATMFFRNYDCKCNICVAVLILSPANYVVTLGKSLTPFEPQAPQP